MLPAEFAKQAYSYINKNVTLVIRTEYSDEDEAVEEIIDSGELLYVHMNNTYLSYRFRGTKDDICREISLHRTYNKYIEAPKTSKNREDIIVVEQRVVDIECTVPKQI